MFRRYETYRIDVDLSKHLLLRRSDDPHDLSELIVVVSPSEEGVAQDHLGHAEIGEDGGRLGSVEAHLR
jgi:hypothetical protein